MHYLPHTKARTPAHNSMQYSTILKSKTAPPSFRCNPMDMSGDQLIGSKLLSETKCCVCFLTSTVFLSWRLKGGRGLSVKSGWIEFQGPGGREAGRCEWLRLMAFHGAARRFRTILGLHRGVRVVRSTVWVSRWVDPNSKGLVVKMSVT